MRTRTAVVGILILGGCIAPWSSSAAGEPTLIIETEFSTDGFGPNRAGATKGTTRTLTRSDRSRTETSNEFSGKILRRFSGVQASINITRLDRGLMWDVSPRSRTYGEITFEQLQRDREEMMGQLGEMREGRGAPDAPPESGDARPTMTFSAPKIEVVPGGATQIVAGVSCKPTAVVATTTGTDSESGTTCDIEWRSDLCLGEAPGEEIAREFSKGAGEALGFTEDNARLVGQSMLAAFAGYGDGFRQIQSELAKLEGMPLRNETSLWVSGSCGMAAPGGFGGANAPPPDADGGEEAEDSGRPLRGLRKKMLGRIKRGRKDKEEAAATAPPPSAETADGGKRKMFGMRITTTSVAVQDTEDTSFEVPAGYERRKERPRPTDRPGR